MTTARDLIYAFVNKRGDDMARFGPPAPYQKMIEAGSGDDDYLHGLLDRVEEDRAHREAERLRQRAETTKLDLLNPFSPYQEQLIRELADLVDPYEMRGGELVRKSDGKPVII